jgi:acyl-CoA thioesterase-1
MRWMGFVLILAFFAASEAKAQVVALDDSSTRGYLLALSDAWPAKLEALLHQRGYNVSVANEGINGDNSEGMLSRKVTIGVKPASHRRACSRGGSRRMRRDLQ